MHQLIFPANSIDPRQSVSADRKSHTHSKMAAGKAIHLSLGGTCNAHQSVFSSNVQTIPPPSKVYTCIPVENIQVLEQTYFRSRRPRMSPTAGFGIGSFFSYRRAVSIRMPLSLTRRPCIAVGLSCRDDCKSSPESVGKTRVSRHSEMIEIFSFQVNRFVGFRDAVSHVSHIDRRAT